MIQWGFYGAHQVMWPDEKDVIRGQCWPRRIICLALCFVFLNLCSPPSLHPCERKGMLKFTPHCPPAQRALPPKLLAHPSFLHCPASFSLVASFKPIIQHSLRFAVYFAAVGGASSLPHLFYTFFFSSFECTSSPSHPLGCGVNFHYTSKV